MCHLVPVLQRLGVRAVLLCVGLSSWSPSSALACAAFSIPEMLESVPADGDTGVPTDVVLYYRALTGTGSDPYTGPGDFELRDARGAQLAMSVQTVGEHDWELWPASPLQANTSYTLTVTRVVKHQLTFQTGAGPLGHTPEPPRAVMRHFLLALDNSSSCGPPRTGSCVSVADDSAWLIYTMIDELGHERGIQTTHGSFQVDLSGIMQSTSFRCVDIRARALNGARSAPLRLCGADAPLERLTDLWDPQLQCSAAGLAWCDVEGRHGIAAGVSGASSSADALHCNTSIMPAPITTSPITTAAASSAAGSPASPSMPNPTARSPSSSASASCSVARRPSQSAAGAWSLAMLVAGATLLCRRARVTHRRSSG